MPLYSKLERSSSPQRFFFEFSFLNWQSFKYLNLWIKKIIFVNRIVFKLFASNLKKQSGIWLFSIWAKNLRQKWSFQHAYGHCMSILYLVQQHRLVVGRKIVTKRAGMLHTFSSYPRPVFKATIRTKLS